MDTVLVPLTQGKFAVIDAADAPLVLAHSWRAKKKHQTWYAVRTIYADGGEQEIRMHRFILSAAPGVMIDHRDGDGLNCTRANLRKATQGQNSANHRLNANNKSGFTGVIFVKSLGKWKAYITHNRQSRTLGYFAEIEDAAKSYDDAARELFGEYARLNFPPLPTPDSELNILRAEIITLRQENAMLRAQLGT